MIIRFVEAIRLPPARTALVVRASQRQRGNEAAEPRWSILLTDCLPRQALQYPASGHVDPSAHLVSRSDGLCLTHVRRRELTIVQVESLDYDVLQCRVDGKPVMPFLADLATRSMRFRISAIHTKERLTSHARGDTDLAEVIDSHLNDGWLLDYRVWVFDTKEEAQETERRLFERNNDPDKYGWNAIHP